MKYLARLRDLPSYFWFSITGVASIAGLLTWLAPSSMPLENRIIVILLIIASDLLIVVFIVMIKPSTEETLLLARELTREARTEFNQHEYEKALTVLNKSIRIDKTNVATWGLLGRTLFYVGRFSECIHPLTEAIELSSVESNRHIHLINRALCYYYQGANGKALDDIEVLLKENPNSSEGIRIRALLWIKQGLFQDAEREINKVLERKPQYLIANAILAILYLRQGKKRKASTQFKATLVMRPVEAIDYYFLSIMQSEFDHYLEAIQYLRISMERDRKFIVRANYEPFFDRIRGDVKYMELIAEITKSSAKMVSGEEKRDKSDQPLTKKRKQISM